MNDRLSPPFTSWKRDRQTDSFLRNTRGSDTYITLHLDTEEDSMLLLGWMENGVTWCSWEILT